MSKLFAMNIIVSTSKRIKHYIGKSWLSLTKSVKAYHIYFLRDKCIVMHTLFLISFIGNYVKAKLTFSSFVMEMDYRLRTKCFL